MNPIQASTSNFPAIGCTYSLLDYSRCLPGTSPVPRVAGAESGQFSVWLPRGHLIRVSV